VYTVALIKKIAAGNFSFVGSYKEYLENIPLKYLPTKGGERNKLEY
jgi:hypothetical protein